MKVCTVVLLTLLFLHTSIYTVSARTSSWILLGRFWVRPKLIFFFAAKCSCRYFMCTTRPITWYFPINAKRAIKSNVKGIGHFEKYHNTILCAGAALMRRIYSSLLC